MSCLVTAGIKIPCKKHKGGAKRVLVANEGVLIPTLTAGEISAFDDTATPTVIEFLFDAGQGGANSTSTNTREGSGFFTETITLNFHVLDNLKSQQLLSIFQGRKQIIVEDFGGKFKLYGLTAGLLANIVENVGVAAGDAYGYTVTLTAEESVLPPFVTEAAMDDLVITAATL
jgi:hypothetical protein